jgi:hypothetical protein
VHLHHLEDGLTLQGRRSLIDACGHDWIRTGVGNAFTMYIGDAVNGTDSLSASADLFDSCHDFLILIDS